MNALAEQLPPFAALLVSGLVLAGSCLALIGSVGLVRLDTFYRRVHAPTLGVSLGAFTMLAGSMVFFSVGQGRWVLHEVLIGLFISVTTPITFMLLVRAALHRDRKEGSGDVPPASSSSGLDGSAQFTPEN
jgi:multicomponent K+:H+ antiporter subunit G